MLLLLLLLVLGVEGDPSPILYPGQVNIGLLADIHQRGGRSGECGPLRPHAVERAMAAVWAAHQVNFRDPQALNIGVYIYDTCGQEDVAQRQAYRLLGHVTNDCEKKIPPLFAVISDGCDSMPPLKLFSAFSVPVITTTGAPDLAAGILSTAPSAPALARGAVSVLHKLRLLEVAVVAEEDSLFKHFSAQVAHVTGMQATHVQDDGGATTNDDDTLATLKLISLYGKSRLKAVVFLVSSEEAMNLLQLMDDSPHIPWLFITPSDISYHLSGKKLRKVLLLSPESRSSPSFDEYFHKLLEEEETIKYHPLLMEYAAGNNETANNSDVSSVSRAVLSLSTALSEVQRSSCRRGAPDCLRQELGHALLRQDFDQEGMLSSLRYNLKGFTEEGNVRELGFYSDDEGLNVEPGVLQPITESPMDSKWKIFEDTSTQTSEEPLLEEEEDQLQSISAKEEDQLQSVSEKEERTSNMRSISLTSHQETQKHEGPVRLPPLSAWLGRPWSLAVLGTSAFLSLSSLYVLVFLLVKACEGGGGGCWLSVLQLLALVCLCCGAVLHVWKPAPLVCGLRRMIHNIGLVFCYGGLLLRGMTLRSQGSLGLGGSVNRGNQLLTLFFVVGVQVALESQGWMPECRRETLASHSYAAILLLTAAAVALSTKSLPYKQSESRSLLCTTFACALIFGCWCVACWLLPSTLVAAPAALLSTAMTVLLGVFLPQLIVLHRHGHKPLVPSYADSLSTVFTLFNNNSTIGRGKKKTLDYQDD